MNLSLFDEPPVVNRERLAERLRQLASEGVHIGTGSWKYEGWFGSVYQRDRYCVRGRYSKKRFEESCISEFAQTFANVCGDFAFYTFPSPEFWADLFEKAPPPLRFSFKVPEEITAPVFPSHPRYGAKGGQINTSFLDADRFQARFLERLRPYRDRVAVMVFEFGTFSRKVFETEAQFVERLNPFLAALPKDFRYSVEIRTPNFLGSQYLECLRSHGCAHTLNAWTRMPELQSQLAMPGIFTADFSVCRALLRVGTKFEDAVKAFAPYDRARSPHPEARQAVRTLIERARKTRETVFIYVANRLEGNAPETIQAIVDC